MAYLENVATVGLGYLVYKRIMAELATTPDNGAVTVKAGELLGWDKPVQFEQAIEKWAGVGKDCTVSGGFLVSCPPPKYTGPEAVPTWCKTDWAGIRSCTTTPPTISQPVDMTGITEYDVVSTIDWTGYENLERFFK